MVLLGNSQEGTSLLMPCTEVSLYGIGNVERELTEPEKAIYSVESTAKGSTRGMKRPRFDVLTNAASGNFREAVSGLFGSVIE